MILFYHVPNYEMLVTPSTFFYKFIDIFFISITTCYMPIFTLFLQSCRVPINCFNLGSELILSLRMPKSF